jgi:hypothetical protein
LDGCAVRIVVATAETDDGRLIDDDPKSQAGRRRVAFPKEIAPELRWHLERFAQPGEGGLVFIGPKGGRRRRSTFRRTWTMLATPWAWPTFISMTCDTPATRWRRPQVRACAS